jgi:glycosyltransferase involved in cell wall biosynthesis
VTKGRGDLIKLTDCADSESLGIVVPAFNEAEAVMGMVRSLRRTLAESRVTYQLLLVDDGSTDTTPRRLAELSEEDPTRTKVITHPDNRGLGRAIVSGYVAAETRWIGWLPADSQFSAADLLALFTARGEADAAVGHVTVAGRTKADRIVRVVLSKGLRVLMRALHPSMPPFNGIMVIRRDLVQPERLVCHTGLVNMEILDRLRRIGTGRPVVEQSIQVFPRSAGRSKVANVKTTLLVVRDLVCLRWAYLVERIRGGGAVLAVRTGGHHHGRR